MVSGTEGGMLDRRVSRVDCGMGLVYLVLRLGSFWTAA